MWVRNFDFGLIRWVELISEGVANRPRREHAGRVDWAGWAVANLGLFNLKAKFAVDSLYFVIDKITR